MLGSAMMKMFGVDDEDEETKKTFLQKLSQALASSATSMIVGRDFGNAVKSFTNLGVEKINEEFFTDLRTADVNPRTGEVTYPYDPLS